MKLISEHLGQIILAVAAVALIVGVVLSFGGVTGGFFESITGKLEEVGTSDTEGGIWNPNTDYTPGGSGGGSGEENVALAAGLYETGTTTLTTSWADLIANNVLLVDGTALTTNGYDDENWVNSASDALGGDLIVADNVGITSIGEYAFAYCVDLTSIEIPASVTGVDYEAFYNCTSLTSVTIPASVTRIDPYAFSCCTSLESITFAGTVEQWNAIELGGDWNYNVPATEVVCSDGTVVLN